MHFDFRVEMCKALEKSQIPCTVVLDSAVGYIMESVDMVMVGAEGVVESGGIINKVCGYPCFEEVTNTHNLGSVEQRGSWDRALIFCIKTYRCKKNTHFLLLWNSRNKKGKKR